MVTPGLRCLNCGNALAGTERFCGQCGQRADTTRLRFVDVIRDLLHAFANVERTPLAFLWALLSGPGRVARDFVDGRRRRHYGPFATLTVIVGTSALAIQLTGYQVLAQDGLAAAPTDLLQRHFNLLQIAQVPLLGGCCALMFRSARLNLFEHMVLAAYALSVRGLLLLVVIPVAFASSSLVPSQMAVQLFWAAWFAYFGWAGAQFYRGRPWLTALKAAAAAALAYLSMIFLIGVGARAHAALLSG
ncbi:hypothetical protein ASC76_02920 [Rhizobacter sp. Root404]|nr:hypothetical protein ASC76_02920 [Rhizobacter sp. Root404]